MSKKIIETDIKIEDIEFPNKGIGYLDGGKAKKVYIKNAIPGQTIHTQIKKKKQKYEGRFLYVTENAEYEIKPKCPAFGSCGGCTYQNITYEKELEYKEKNVLKLFKNSTLKYDEECFLPVLGSPVEECYRNKMEFSFGDTGKDGELSLGMKKRNSYYEVVNAGECLIVHEDIRKVLSAVLGFFRESGETFYHKMAKTGTLRHLLVRRSYFEKEMIVGIVTTSGINTDLTGLKDILVNTEFECKLKGVIHIINDSVADVVKADEVKILYGEDCFKERLLGLEFKISLFSFFQTNSAGAEILYDTVRNFAGDISDKVVFDLYCGTGTITQLMAEKAKKVIGIELVEEAVRSAEENTRMNGIANCTFIVGDVLKKVDELEDKPEIIILDPPREGINPKAIDKIASFGAETIVYVSCKASSLVKDLSAFEERGYVVEKVQCVDMFPGTYHIETVCLLSKGDVKSQKLRVEFSLEDMDTDGFKKGATYNAIRDWIKEKYGYRVTNLNIAQVKQKHGIIERENYNKPKTPESKQPGCPEEKVKAIEDAMRHFQMI